MNYPTDLKYSKTHEWVKEEDGMTVVGISDFAQDSLGDIVFIGLPSVGDTVTMGEALGDVESVKAVSDIVCPVTGVVAEVNDDLADAPENLNSDPYGSWIIKVKDVEATEELLDAAAYEAFCATEEAEYGLLCSYHCGGTRANAGSGRRQVAERSLRGSAAGDVPA